MKTTDKPEIPDDFSDELRTEIEAAVVNLGADRTDLEYLMVYISANEIALQQIPGLLKQSHSRLVKLRTVLSECTKLAAENKGLSEIVQQVASSIQPGEKICLDDTCQLLKNTYSHLTGCTELSVMLFACQGLIDSIRLQYQDAIKCYTETANLAGLTDQQRWQYQLEAALLMYEYGREFNSKSMLDQAAHLLENDISGLAPKNLQPDEWATTQQAIGTVKGVLGHRQSGTRNLEEAITAFEAAIGIRGSEQSPYFWAESRNALGNALGALGHRQGDEEMLGKSIEAFESALEHWTDQDTEQRATTQNNLAAVLQSLGQRNKDSRMLKRAVETYKEVLKVWTRERQPQNWATTMNNLGTALRLLGEHRKGPRTLEQSVAAYNSALAIRNRACFPGEWATIQNNLGAALYKLGQREENPDLLEQSTAAYESALKEWTQEKTPLTWGMTMANLGVARREMADMTASMESAEDAVKELEAVTDFFRHASHAHYSELSIEELAKARNLAAALALEKGKYAGFVER